MDLLRFGKKLEGRRLRRPRYRGEHRALCWALPKLQSAGGDARATMWDGRPPVRLPKTAWKLAKLQLLREAQAPPRGLVDRRTLPPPEARLRGTAALQVNNAGQNFDES